MVSGEEPDRSLASPSLQDAQHFERRSSFAAGAGLSSLGFAAGSSAAKSGPAVSLSASGTSDCLGLPQANAKRAMARSGIAIERDRFFMPTISSEALS